MTTYTTRLALPKPDFDSAPWHEAFHTALDMIDAGIWSGMMAATISGNWANSTLYSAGARVLDATDNSLWQAVVTHTSSASPTTFAAHRTANPTHWVALNAANSLLVANNLSDLNNLVTARQNLGVEIGVDVLAYSAAVAYTNVANTFVQAQTIVVAAATGLTVRATDDSASGGPNIVLNRVSPTPSGGDIIGQLSFEGRDSAANATTFALINAVIVDPTNTTEDAYLRFSTVVNGAFAGRMRIGAGVYHSTVAGGDKGDNTLNYGTIYQNNVAFASAAFVATGVSGATVPLLNGVNTWSGAQTIEVASLVPLALRTNDNGASAGPTLVLDRNNATPAASDLIGSLIFRGRDSGGNVTDFASLAGQITDPTGASEDGILILSTMTAGSLTTAAAFGGGVYHPTAAGGDKGANTLNVGVIYQNNVALASAAFVATGTSGATIPLLNAANTFSALQVIEITTAAAALALSSTDAGTAVGPTFIVGRYSATPAVNDILGGLQFNGNDSGLVATIYARISATIVDPTGASEDGRIRFETLVAGSLTQRMFLGAGMYSLNATGGDKGIDSANFGAVYDDDVLLTCYVFDAVENGRVDLEKWNAVVGKEHFGARKFSERLGGEYDPLDLKKYTRHWREKGHLTAMPGEKNYNEATRPNTGKLIQRMWETEEIHAVHLAGLDERLSKVEEKVL